MFDIAVSYASEQRDYVKRFVEFMRKKRLKVYFDVNEQTRMLGTLLHEELPHIYSQESLIRVIFLSEEYTNKPFTKLESEIILAENVFDKNKMYVFKFSDVSLPGLNRNMVYASIKDYPEPESFAALVYSSMKHTQNRYSTSLFYSLDYILYEKLRTKIKGLKYYQLNKEDQKHTTIYRVMQGGKVALYIQISKDADHDMIYIWLYGTEPMEKSNTYNGLIKKESNIFHLNNRGIIDTLEDQIPYESLENLVEAVFAKARLIMEQQS